MGHGSAVYRSLGRHRAMVLEQLVAGSQLAVLVRGLRLVTMILTWYVGFPLTGIIYHVTKKRRIGQ